VSPDAAAQATQYPNTFPTLASCTEALASGRLRYYEPRYFGLAAREPVDGRERIRVPLESDLCLEMLVVGGVRFVAQREGTVFRARRLADGSLSLYARDDCGNPVYGAILPAAAPPPPEPAALPSRPTFNPPEPVTVIPVRAVAPPAPKKRGGFCSSKACRVGVAVVGGVALGYTAWRVWPCPPGTRRR
jgi:hypothetical protein